ncbi:MAG: hypothetical protein IT484_00415 [Gammaproteobacteria bacterium]|nr:hypothetical protein [Gammaproteobacteria bacterium]
MGSIRTSVALAAASVILCASGTALATPIYTSWGSLPGATFGGTGIPNTSVAKTEVFVNGSTTVTLALTAHARYSNPTVTDNGAGDYYAGPGSNCGIATDPVGCPSATQGALWNVGYYISVSGTDPNFNDFGDFTFTVYYDFDPGAGTAFGSLGRINVNNMLIANSINPATTTLAQGSENMMFSYLATPVPFVVTPPTYGAFNPNSLGEYNFYIGFTANNLPAFSGAVGVDVNVVPVPGAVWLLGSGLGLLGWVRRRASQVA